MRLQFSLFRFGLAIALVSILLVAFTNATPIWHSIAATATILVFLVAISAAVCSIGRQRAFWNGFCIWGLAYVSIATIGLKSDLDRNGVLLTTKALKAVHSLVVSEVTVSQNASPAGGGGGFPPPMSVYKPDHDNFLRIGQLAWSWLFAVSGGIITRAFFCTENTDEVH